MSIVQEAPPTLTGVGPPPTAGGAPYRFSAATFGRMLDAEVFSDDARVELWDGQVFEKMAKTQAHAVAGNLASLCLTRVLPDGWFPGGENPVAINPQRVPLPDLVVLRGTPKDYIDRRPEPADVGLVVELSLSSLKDDVGAKMVGYAAAGIPAYWVVNLVANLVLAFERPIPAEGRYESSQAYAIGQSVPLRLDGILIAEIPAADLLPIRT